ncbi:M23 family metallopeptidase [Desulfosarcina sp. OttesenSCG-928-G10]|nr:M23 family metallopeptidase [Desulfosarcina sp. OttesenSCG-928-G10]
MRHKKLSVLIFDEMGAVVRQTAFPKILFPLAVFFLVGMVAAFAIGLYAGISDYQHLKAENRVMAQAAVDLQQKEAVIAKQQAQLTELAQKVDVMKGQLTELHEFEKKIRIIADLEPRDQESHLLGVGGPDPDDLLPLSALKRNDPTLARDISTQLDKIDQRASVQQTVFSDMVGQLEGKRERLSATPSIVPLKGAFSSGFGYRDAPFSAGTRKFHNGIDISAKRGTPVRAPANGVVTFAESNGTMGNMITLDHGFNIVTAYGHLDKILKKKGDPVKRGDVIGLVGNTGRSTGSHLHYEVRLNGKAVNPVQYY